MLRTRLLIVWALATGSAISMAGQSAKPPAVDVPGLLARIGARVEAYYQRAQSIICTETISFETLDDRVMRRRRVAYDLRLSWEKSDETEVPEGHALRTLKAVNGKPPKDNDRDENKCLDPKPVAVDTLSFLLPHNQTKYAFTYKSMAKAEDGRPAVTIDFVPVSKDKPKYTWRDTCFGVEAPTRTRGRLWVDQAGGDILRIDETIVGPLDVDLPREEERKSGVSSLVLDRLDSSVRYKMIAFSDPEEHVMLPDHLEFVSTIRGRPRQRILHKFTGYQRFVTGGRLVTEQ